MDVRMFDVDKQRFNPDLYSTRIHKGKGAKKSQSPQLDLSPHADEYEMMVYCVNKLMDSYPNLVNRLLLELNRYFQEKRSVPLRRYPQVSTAAKQLTELRRYLFRLDSIPPSPSRNDPAKLSLVYQYPMMKEAGVALTQEETMSLSISSRYLLYAAPYISNVRFWGKIFGLYQDYYIMECELIPSEIDKRNKKEEEVKEEAKKEALEEERMGEKLVKVSFERHALDEKVLELKGNESLFTGFNLPSRPSVPDKEEVLVPEEEVGTGTNKKLYLVSNNPRNEWCELPTVTPYQIVTGRKITRYFTGHLNDCVNSNPAFPGKELNYLRCQIARISAGTQISPVDFYRVPGGEEEVTLGEEEEGLEDGEVYMNPDYSPLSVQRLAEPVEGLSFWVHHTEHILEQGRTKFWLGPADLEAEGSDEPRVQTGPRLLSQIKKDRRVEAVRPWSLSLRSAMFPNKATAVARSNLWPGAFAYARDRQADHVYVGWGKKTRTLGSTPMEPPVPGSEYPQGPDIVEHSDPTVEFTQVWIQQHTPPERPPPEEDRGELEENLQDEHVDEEEEYDE